MGKKKSIRQRRTKKSEPSNLENLKDSFKIIYSNYKGKFNSSKKSFKKVKDKHKTKINNLKNFLLVILGYGLLVNYPLHFLFGMKFSFFTFPAWGIVYYFIKDEFVEWIRGLIAKR